MPLNTDKLISDVVEFTERRMPKAQSQALVDLETAFEQLQAENKRLKGVIEKYARHTHRCFMGQYNSLKTGNGCDCGLSEAIKTISKE